ncbi:MAG: hypothetical protein K6357_07625 [Elusimicrobiota bacterium]
MKKRIIFIFAIFTLDSLVMANFNLIDRLASPFSYNDSLNSYPDNYSNPDYSKPEEYYRGNNAIFIIIILIVVLLFPQRYRYSNHIDPPLLFQIIKSILILFWKKSEKNFKNTTNKNFYEMENEAINILNQININPDDIKEFAGYCLKQYFLFLTGQENNFKDIATKYLYELYEKQSIELYQRGIRTEIKDFSIEDIKIVNVRYTNYEKAISVYIMFSSKYYYLNSKNGSFISKDHFPVKRILFLTFIMDNGNWRLSLIENNGESYVANLQNIFQIDSNTSEFTNLSSKESKTQDEFSKAKLQILIAENIFGLYSWWKDPTTLQKFKINQELFKKIKQERLKIKNDKNIIFEIYDFKILSIDFLTSKKNYTNLLTGVIIRLNFSIKGKFAKNSILIVPESEIKLDEIFEFEIDKNEVVIKDLVKRFINSEKEIGPNPLQIEWYM